VTKVAPAARSTKAAKKAVAKTPPAKKAASAARQPTKEPPTKAPGKKAPAKKAAAKKLAEKAPPKKAAAKAAPARTAKAASKARPTRTAATTTAKKAAPKTGVKKVTTKRTAPKKAPAKKVASLESLAVKEGEEAWTKAELDEVLEELHGHADRLRTELHDQELELAGLMRDAGDGAGQDQADLGATSFERDHELTVVNNSREMLAQTERALARIADGSYGVCESCGNPIGKMRVMAFPRATLCLSCKQRDERR
jgi:RNA polymerase-binding protein DksA